MNDVIEMPRHMPAPTKPQLSVGEVVQQAHAVQEIMQAVMKEGEHYGRIPGTDKPTLYKAGAEKLCMTFRIADEYKVEDLSTPDCIRYRVECIGKHQTTQIVLGSGMGEGSSGEEKYKWRKAVCPEEFAATPANMRRVKYGKKQNGFYTVDQVRTEPADLANTVLKMACKRAKMAMVLNVTAASDCFTQDLEDLDSVLAQHLTDSDGMTDAEKRRRQWIDDQKANIRDATNAGELKKTMAYALAKVRENNDASAEEEIMAAADAKAKTAKRPATPTTDTEQPE